MRLSRASGRARRADGEARMQGERSGRDSEGTERGQKADYDGKFATDHGGVSFGSKDVCWFASAVILTSGIGPTASPSPALSQKERGGR